MRSGVTREPAAPDLVYWQVLAWLTLGTIVLFLARPDIDLAVTAWFAGPDGFAVASNSVALAIRDFFRNWFYAVGLCVLLMLVLALARGGRWIGVPARAWGCALAAMVLAPGLLANGILKSNWGRARPDEIEGSAGACPTACPSR